MSGSVHSFGRTEECLTLVWKIEKSLIAPNGAVLPLLHCNAGTLSEPGAVYPTIYKQYPAPTGQTAEVRIVKEVLLNSEELNVIKQSSAKPGSWSPQVSIIRQRNGKFVLVKFEPIFLKNGRVYKVESFCIEWVSASAVGSRGASRGSWKDNSVLASGDWFKLATKEPGIYKIDQTVLKKMGLNPAQVNPNNIRIYSNGGGMQPERNDVYRHDDLVENPVMIYGGQDGRFDASDYVLFYAASPHSRVRNGSRFVHQVNIYSDSNYCFFTLNGGLGTPKRITSRPSISNATQTVRSFNEHLVHEQELVNLISSGREWYGEGFGIKNRYAFEFNIPFIDRSADINISVRAVIRSLNSESSLLVSANGVGAATITGGKTDGDYTSSYASVLTGDINGKPAGDKLNMSIDFSAANSESLAWLDKIEINCRKNLFFTGPQMHFRDISSLGSSARFIVQRAPSDLQVWDVTDPTAPVGQSISFSGSDAEFSYLTDTIREYVAFAGNTFNTPVFSSKVENQNYHSLFAKSPEMLIVAAPEFLSQAQELADFHKELDGLSTEVVQTTKIYNEFSGGRQDLTGIKDFLRMLYFKALPDTQKTPRYVLLFGDASYDYKNRISGNTNFVPTYQTSNSLSPTGSLASDDYIAMLDEDSKGFAVDATVLLGVGRLPVKSTAQANAAVRKIKTYVANSSFGSWRNSLVFVADDEDRNLHMSQANNLANYLDTAYPAYNVTKVLFDAYPQRSTPGGQRYLDVNKAIDNAVQRGCLFINYIGHGGELGWAHERVLEVSQINKWSNLANMPLFVTATCEFTRFDDPKRTSAGEFVFLNPDGGGIGLLTTTRLVYSGPNYELAKVFNSIAFEPVGDEMPRLGDILQKTKADPKNFNPNTKVFALIGDPALRLAYPREWAVSVSMPDTIKALDKVTIKGEVRNRKTGSILTGFNGVIYPTVFDKKRVIESLDNDQNGVFTFEVRNNVLFRGKASVNAGKFEFTFVAPKDINFNFGNGKISYYANNAQFDAQGYTFDFQVGGQNLNAPADNAGPLVELFMNDTTFVFGGLTDENPSIYAKLFDDNGINTTGNGVGHDITAILDENTASELILNDYYQTNLNSYQAGLVKYLMSDLSEGPHRLSLKAWDVYNNSGTDYTEFIVASSERLALSHVLNYPNPFTTNTDFYLEHNQPGQELFVRVQVLTISGKVVKTIDGSFNSIGYRIGPINWNARDEFGDRLGRGTYIYRVQVTAQNGEKADKYEKMVILY
jgi:hypothetical protein